MSPANQKKPQKTRQKKNVANTSEHQKHLENILLPLRWSLIFILNTIVFLSILGLSQASFPLLLRKIVLYFLGMNGLLFNIYIYFWLFKKEARKLKPVLLMLCAWLLVALLFEILLQEHVFFSTDFRVMLRQLNFNLEEGSYLVGGILPMSMVWGLRMLLGRGIFYTLMALCFLAFFIFIGGLKYVKILWQRLRAFLMAKKTSIQQKSESMAPQDPSPIEDKKTFHKNDPKESFSEKITPIKESPHILHEIMHEPNFELDKFDGLTAQKKDGDKGEEKQTKSAKPTKPKASSSEILPVSSSKNVYKPPMLSLLAEGIQSLSGEKRNIQKNKEQLAQILENFKIDAAIVEEHVGPTVTMYEVKLSPGVKINKLTNLSNDIALGMAADEIRIAPVGGKATVGIEIPNERKVSVGLRRLLESKNFTDSNNPLSCALGMDIAGNAIVLDLNKMPHLLIAGATGSGKSVCINTIIVSLLYKASPEEVKMIMIDPKVVELSVYNTIPHLLYPVVTEPQKAASILQWVVMEMNRRYQAFAENGVRDIRHYNEQFGQDLEKRMPFIVVIIDELADLMLTSPKDVEDAICRIAQMARAAGIHLIIATQRPSVDVITGLIKANIPSRIAFSVSSQVDSRTILDMVGAEKLLGKGDMLYYPVGVPKPMRLQGAFISDKEVQMVVDSIARLPEEEMKPQENNIESYLQDTEKEEIVEDEKWDALIFDILDFVLTEKSISVSKIQRKFRVGYARAARLVDNLEQLKVIGGYNGSKPRDVIMNGQNIQELKEQIRRN